MKKLLIIIVGVVFLGIASVIGFAIFGKKQPVQTGYITGHVTIRPFCPVERVGHLCTVPAEAYTSRDVVVYEANGLTIKENMKLDTEGNYKIALAPGTYFIQIQPAGIGPGEKKKITVTASQTSTIDFDIDTGIR